MTSSATILIFEMKTKEIKNNASDLKRDHFHFIAKKNLRGTSCVVNAEKGAVVPFYHWLGAC